MKAERPYPAYTVTPKAEAAILKGHPWVYADEITAAPDTAPENGAVVDVLSRKGRYLGSGLLSEASKIRVRLLSRNANDRFDEDFWRRRIEYAWAYRKAIYPVEDLQCCRVVFGEADSLPGVTVDRFGPILSVQILSFGMDQRKELLARLRWRYPHAAACAAPAKVTATQAAALEEEPGALLVREEESPAFQRPQFAQAALGLTAAQRGTAVHQVMQTIRLDRAATPSAVAQELARLTQQAFLTPEQAAAVDPGEVAAFFASSLGEAVRGAAELHREYPFSVLAPAERFLPDAPAGEEVLLQGVVDCWFATEEGITLVDFKTDRISPQRLEARGQRYRGQMAAYAYALEEVTGRPVTRRVLWFLHLGRGLEMP